MDSDKETLMSKLDKFMEEMRQDAARRDKEAREYQQKLDERDKEAREHRKEAKEYLKEAREYLKRVREYHKKHDAFFNQMKLEYGSVCRQIRESRGRVSYQ